MEHFSAELAGLPTQSHGHCQLKYSSASSIKVILYDQLNRKPLNSQNAFRQEVAGSVDTQERMMEKQRPVVLQTSLFKHKKKSFPPLTYYCLLILIFLIHLILGEFHTLNSALTSFPCWDLKHALAHGLHLTHTLPPPASTDMHSTAWT